MAGLGARTADAFCGFYVAGGDQQMFNDATQVVLMRQGTRTVLSMQSVAADTNATTKCGSGPR